MADLLGAEKAGPNPRQSGGGRGRAEGALTPWFVKNCPSRQQRSHVVHGACAPSPPLGKGRGEGSRSQNRNSERPSPGSLPSPPSPLRGEGKTQMRSPCSRQRRGDLHIRIPGRTARKMPEQMTTAEAVVATLIAHGIETVSALPGIQNDHLSDALYKAQNRIRTPHPRHEQGAAYMALGAALATGKPQAFAVVND